MALCSHVISLFRVGGMRDLWHHGTITELRDWPTCRHFPMFHSSVISGALRRPRFNLFIPAVRFSHPPVDFTSSEANLSLTGEKEHSEWMDVTGLVKKEAAPLLLTGFEHMGLLPLLSCTNCEPLSWKAGCMWTESMSVSHTASSVSSWSMLRSVLDSVIFLFWCFD